MKIPQGQISQVARKCGVSRQAVQRWNRLGLVPPKHAAVVAPIVGESVAHLWGCWLRARESTQEPEGSNPNRELAQQPSSPPAVGHEPDDQGEPFGCAQCGRAVALIGGWCRECHPERCAATSTYGRRCRNVGRCPDHGGR
jgi:hypothetical protein